MIEIVIENGEQVRRLLEQFDEQGREYHVTLISHPEGGLEIRLEPHPGRLRNLQEVKRVLERMLAEGTGEETSEWAVRGAPLAEAALVRRGFSFPSRGERRGPRPQVGARRYGRPFPRA